MEHPLEAGMAAPGPVSDDVRMDHDLDLEAAAPSTKPARIDLKRSRFKDSQDDGGSSVNDDDTIDLASSGDDEEMTESEGDSLTGQGHPRAVPVPGLAPKTRESARRHSHVHTHTHTHVHIYRPPAPDSPYNNFEPAQGAVTHGQVNVVPHPPPTAPPVTSRIVRHQQAIVRQQRELAVPADIPTGPNGQAMCCKIPSGFKCMWAGCAKVFKKFSACVRHYRTHTGEKPFKCPTCGLTFAERGNMMRHYGSHELMKPWRCHTENCSMAFARKDHLISHLRSKHEGPNTELGIGDLNRVNLKRNTEDIIVRGGQAAPAVLVEKKGGTICATVNNSVELAIATGEPVAPNAQQLIHSMPDPDLEDVTMMRIQGAGVRIAGVSDPSKLMQGSEDLANAMRMVVSAGPGSVPHAQSGAMVQRTPLTAADGGVPVQSVPGGAQQQQAQQQQQGSTPLHQVSPDPHPPSHPPGLGAQRTGSPHGQGSVLSPARANARVQSRRQSQRTRTALPLTRPQQGVAMVGSRGGNRADGSKVRYQMGVQGFAPASGQQMPMQISADMAGAMGISLERSANGQTVIPVMGPNGVVFAAAAPMMMPADANGNPIQISYGVQGGVTGHQYILYHPQGAAGGAVVQYPANWGYGPVQSSGMSGQQQAHAQGVGGYQVMYGTMPMSQSHGQEAGSVQGQPIAMTAPSGRPADEDAVAGAVESDVTEHVDDGHQGSAQVGRMGDIFNQGTEVATMAFKHGTERLDSLMLSFPGAHRHFDDMRLMEEAEAGGHADAVDPNAHPSELNENLDGDDNGSQQGGPRHDDDEDEDDDDVDDEEEDDDEDDDGRDHEAEAHGDDSGQHGH